VLSYSQPADHGNPLQGSFEQRLTLLHRSTDRPMVLHTTGYNVRISPTLRSEPTRLVDGNQISVEQRFFTPSRPDPADWSTLDIWQAATDHHRLVDALDDVYPRQWLSTGASKGGMTSVYHRRFYPDDVDGTVAYVAPNDVVNAEDSAYTEFFEEVGSPECRSALTALELEALGPRRAALGERFAASAAAEGWTFERTIGTVDRALEMVVMDTAWAFWPFGTQLGYPVPSFDRLEGLLRYRGLYQPRTVVPSELPMRFEPQRMRDIDQWVTPAASFCSSTARTTRGARRRSSSDAGLATRTGTRPTAPTTAPTSRRWGPPRRPRRPQRSSGGPVSHRRRPLVRRHHALRRSTATTKHSTGGGRSASHVKIRMIATITP
jgi:hypothetical protein